MRSTLVFILIVLFSGCSLEKSLEKGEFDAVITKLGDNPVRNTVQENMTVGDAFRKSNRVDESVPFYREAIKQGIPDEAANLYLAQGLKAEQKYEEARDCAG